MHPAQLPVSEFFQQCETWWEDERGAVVQRISDFRQLRDQNWHRGLSARVEQLALHVQRPLRRGDSLSEQAFCRDMNAQISTRLLHLRERLEFLDARWGPFPAAAKELVIRHAALGLEVRMTGGPTTACIVSRLQLRAALRVRTPADPGPSALWIQYFRPTDVSRVPPPFPNLRYRGRHRDYPALLAEALDVIYAERGSTRRASARLHVSLATLRRLLRLDERAMRLPQVYSDAAWAREST